jgi:hypothetical protein
MADRLRSPGPYGAPPIDAARLGPRNIGPGPSVGRPDRQIRFGRKLIGTANRGIVVEVRQSAGHGFTGTGWNRYSQIQIRPDAGN